VHKTAALLKTWKLNHWELIISSLVKPSKFDVLLLRVMSKLDIGKATYLLEKNLNLKSEYDFFVDLL